MAIDTPARIAIIGAGPIGLEAALYARYLGYDVDIYERGLVGENLRRWGHVRLFTPFGENCSPLALAALAAQNSAYEPPAPDAHLTGHELVERYLAPLAQSDLLAESLHEKTRVISISRDELLKGDLADDEERGDGMFRLLLETAPAPHVHERVAAADVVIDTSGVYGNHNWLGAGGAPAMGEVAAEHKIEYGLPDIQGRDRGAYAARSTLVVGDGDSAATSIVSLAEVARHTPGTWITWVTRARAAAEASGPINADPSDPLAERRRLAQEANALTADDAEHVTFRPGVTVQSVVWHSGLDRFTVRLSDRPTDELEFDRIIANVGFRADRRCHAELHVEECPLTGGCKGLVEREPNFYILGAKSRGRDSRFLLRDGRRQIRELFAIIGDRAELDLYATMANAPG